MKKTSSYLGGVLTGAAFVLLFSSLAFAQNNPIHSIYFQSSQSNSQKNQTEILKHLLSSQPCENYQIEIHAFSDTVGSTEANLLLSEKRAEYVKSIITSLSLPIEPKIIVKCFGESETETFGKTYKNLESYRRVDIFSTCIESAKQATEDEEITIDESDNNANDIRELYAQLSDPYETFTIDPTVDNTIQCKHKTFVYIPANTLTVDNKIAQDEMTVQVLVCRTPSEMISSNLTTQTTNDRILKTFGMVYINAYDKKGNIAGVVEGGVIDIALPTIEDTSKAKLFQGVGAERGNIKWLPEPFDLDFYSLGLPIRSQNINISSDCQTAWCRFWRNVFPKKSTTQVDGFGKSNVTRTYYDSYPLYSTIEKSTLDSLFTKYDVNNVWELQKKMKKEKIDSLETTYLNKPVPAEDINYYILSVSNFGWANCDVFDRMGKGPKEEIFVEQKPSKAIDCKIIYKNENIILPFANAKTKYSVDNIPVGTALSVIILKYENEEAFAYIEDFKMQKGGLKINPEFKKYTIQELKAALEKLN